MAQKLDLLGSEENTSSHLSMQYLEEHQVCTKPLESAIILLLLLLK